MKELPSIHEKKVVNPKFQPAFGSENLASVKHVVAISSGKGGVGKSTVSVNLAVALAKKGYQVGLMDADVYGPSVPKMLSGFKIPQEKNGKLVPIERHGVKFMSMGLLTNEDSPVIWRGPMATKLIQHFLTQVDWGPLDYLLIDLPPGTGDVQLTLSQGAPLRGAVIVTTPQDVAVSVTMRGIRMFDEVHVPILGVVENMSGFICEHCHHETAVFKKGGAEKTAAELGLQFLGKIPLDPGLTEAGDQGEPLILNKRESHAVMAFENIVTRLVAEAEKVKKLTEENSFAPTKIEISGDQVLIEWPGDVQAKIASKKLRLACECAVCVDEVSGERKIQESGIQPGIHPLGFRQVGRYGVQISWSDGHHTGIYTFDKLRDLSEVAV